MNFQVVALPSGAQDAPPAAETPEKIPGPLSRLATLQTRAAPLQQKLQAAFKSGDLATAEKLCREFMEQVPFSPDGPYNLACVLARTGRTAEALDALENAIDQGFRNLVHLRTDPDLNDLHDEPRFQALLKKAETAPVPAAPFRPEPAFQQDGIARVEDANTLLEARTGLLLPLFQPRDPFPEDLAPAAFDSEAAKLVNAWWHEKTAAGHRGDFYDNRDGDHSDLPARFFPQLSRIEYGEESRLLQLHWGLSRQIFHPGVVLGNASVAWTAGPFWRSMPRLAVTDARHLGMLQLQFNNNQLYVYPSHHDYRETDDPRRVEDVHVANTPYLVATLGSSGSDQVFLKAFALAMAAFRPETKQKLVAEKALAPTLQWIFRQSNRPVQEDEDYFTGKAHPPVFRGEDLQPEKMVRLAHELTPDSLPPLVHLRVIEEDQPIAGRDYFDAFTNEKIFDTPWAIARVFRGAAQTRRLVIDASTSRDLNGRPLRFRWAVLCGDAETITVHPLNAEGSRVELIVPWHERRAIPWRPDFRTTRADIACFAGNGTHWSTPAFVSFYFPDNEQRTYDERGRLRQRVFNDRYVDPLLVTPRQWRDEYTYDEAGLWTGWKRVRENGDAEHFTADGQIVVERDGDGKAVRSAPLRYKRVQAAPDQAPRLEQTLPPAGS